MGNKEQRVELTAYERLYNELDELTVRRNKLADFIGTAKFMALPTEQQALLYIQLPQMEALIYTLARRKDIWKE